jgi:hypothetical protein
VVEHLPSIQNTLGLILSTAGGGGNTNITNELSNTVSIHAIYLSFHVTEVPHTLKKKIQPGMVVHIYNPNTKEAEAQYLQIQGQVT